jgi:hypothetical protein
MLSVFLRFKLDGRILTRLIPAFVPFKPPIESSLLGLGNILSDSLLPGLDFGGPIIQEPKRNRPG